MTAHVAAHLCADRLKISLASGYALARLAFSCLYWADTYNQVMFEGKSMMYWCKREVVWGADWLLKTHISKNPKDVWQWNDKFAVMVRRCHILSVRLSCST